jgi:hypothetical protein
VQPLMMRRWLSGVSRTSASVPKTLSSGMFAYPLMNSVQVQPLAMQMLKVAQYNALMFRRDQLPMIDPVCDEEEVIQMESLIRKRRAKMKKHKIRKRRKRERKAAGGRPTKK